MAYNYSDRLEGSDSAPHPAQNKWVGQERDRGHCAAGVFSSGWVTPLIIDALEIGTRQGWITKAQTTRENIEGFLSFYGRDFYRIPVPPSHPTDSEGSKTPRIRLERHGQVIPQSIKSLDGQIEVVPFKRGEKTWSLSWI